MSEIKREAFTIKTNDTKWNEGKFEIITITEGIGNGWKFTEEVLRESVKLWDKVECFIDHSESNRFIKDLGGEIINPVYDEEHKGIKADLLPIGPGSEHIKNIGLMLLDNPGNDKIGFSADILFEGARGKVEKIINVNSVDLVYKPARGGKYLRIKEQEGEKEMEELEEVKKIKKELLDLKLQAKIEGADLEKESKELLKDMFSGKEYLEEELNKAIENQKNLKEKLTSKVDIRSSKRIENAMDEADKLQIATDQLFGIGEGHSSVPRLSGIKELYLSLTGDTEMRGGYYSNRVKLATTADFPGLITNSLNKIIVKTWDNLGKAGYNWWENIATVEHFNSLNDITGTLVGHISDLPAIEEGAEYTELAVGDSPESVSFKKYGGYVPITLEVIDRDLARMLSGYAKQLAIAGLRKISKLISEIFTSNSGVGPTMADTGALFNATAVTTAGGHANLTETALSANQWDAVCQAVYAQPMLIKNEAGSYGIGPAMAINPKFILVPRTLQKTAMEICTGALVREESHFYDNVLKGTAVPVVVPEWTDVNNWAAVCDPLVAPAIYVGERYGLKPEIYYAGDDLSPAVFMNDEHRFKIRQFLAVWVNDYRPLHKVNVAG